MNATDNDGINDPNHLVDERQIYLAARHMGCMEAMWKLHKYRLAGSHHIVLCTFITTKSKLLAFFSLCRFEKFNHEEAQAYIPVDEPFATDLLYQSIPEYYTWTCLDRNTNQFGWKRRSQRDQYSLGRVPFMNILCKVNYFSFVL